jgi:MPBQ/MSBQ methyltransferase
MVIACWCQREAGINGAPPLSKQDQEDLNFLYEEWAHPFFISIQEFCRLMQVRRSFAVNDGSCRKIL